jgi:tetratricopeptide (TPR) repeat protein
MYAFLGEDAGATEHAERALALATEAHDRAALGNAEYVLGLHAFFTGRVFEAPSHARRAIEYLGETGDRSALAQAHFVMALSLALVGAFDDALAALAVARSTGEEIGNPRIQTPATWATGMVHHMRGDYETAVTLCEQAVAISPDPLNTADALGHLGIAHLERGDAARAASCLEQSVALWRRFHGRPDQGWFSIFLAEAYLLDGQRERAHRLAEEALADSRARGYWFGIGFARRALAHIARAEGALANVQVHLEEALRTFESVPTPYFAARIHLDLGSLAYERGDVSEVIVHLRQARQIFVHVGARGYVERADRLAREARVVLD